MAPYGEYPLHEGCPALLLLVLFERLALPTPTYKEGASLRWPKERRHLGDAAIGKPARICTLTEWVGATSAAVTLQTYLEPAT